MPLNVTPSLKKKFNFIIIFNMSLTCSQKTLMQSESYKILLQNKRIYRIPICNQRNQRFKIFVSIWKNIDISFILRFVWNNTEKHGYNA
jgi:hypothetical protein